MATFRIRFVNSLGFVAEAIDVLSNATVDHTEFDSGTGWLGAHYQDGVRDRPYNYMVPSVENIFELEVPDDIYNKAMLWAKAQIGTPYNFGAIASIMLHVPSLNEAGHVICSQFAYEMLLHLGLNPLNRDVVLPHDVTPGGLMLSPIFDGKMVSHVVRTS
jgi:uncharacterized protein YycO